MEVIKSVFGFIFKTIWKLFLIVLWGAGNVLEMIISQINAFLHKNIKK